MTIFFSCLTEYDFQIWRNYIFFGHMPIFGSIWRQVACLKNIDKYWKQMENMKIYWKVARLYNIENIWKNIGKIFVSWLITPDACNLEFEILAYMPYDQKNVICEMTKNIQSFGGPGNNI